MMDFRIKIAIFKFVDFFYLTSMIGKSTLLALLIYVYFSMFSHNCTAKIGNKNTYFKCKI